MSTTSSTSMVENCKRRRSAALGYAAIYYDNPPALWREEAAVIDALPYVENITWSYALQIIKKFLFYKFPVPGEESIKSKDLPRVSDALFQKLHHLNATAGVPAIAEAYCDYVVDQIVMLVSAEENALVPAVLPSGSTNDDEVAIARRKNASKEAQTFKDSLSHIHKQIKAYDNNNTTKYPFHQHLREFNNKVDYYKTTSASGFLLLNSISENNCYLTDNLLRTYFDQTFEHVTKENLKNSLLTQSFNFTNFTNYIETLESLFNSESQTVNYVNSQLRNDFIHKGDLEAAKLVNRFDEIIIRNASLPSAQQLSSAQIKSFFMNSIQKGQNPHNAGMSVHLQKLVGSSNDWNLIKEKFSDLIITDAALYHSECPESAPCRSEEVIDLDASTTRSYSNKSSKKSASTTVDPHSTIPSTPIGFNMDTFNSFMQAQTKLAQDMSSKLANLGSSHGGGHRKQISAAPGPHDNWTTMGYMEFTKLKADLEALEGCVLGSKGPWIKGTNNECSKCKPQNLPCEHHDSSCFRTYPWLRGDKTRQFNNNRGYNNQRGNRNNGPYNRRGRGGK